MAHPEFMAPLTHRLAVALLVSAAVLAVIIPGAAWAKDWYPVDVDVWDLPFNSER